MNTYGDQRRMSGIFLYCSLSEFLEKDSLAEPRSCCFFPRLVASKLQWSLSIGICGHIWPAVPAFYVGTRVPNRGPHAD